jgi:hypothetical protein
MAHDEMERVRELDRGFLREFAENVWFCYAEEDGWVGGERGVVMRAVGGTAAEGRVVCGRGSVPHAFCISARGVFFFSTLSLVGCSNFISPSQTTAPRWLRSASSGCAPVVFWVMSKHRQSQLTSKKRRMFRCTVHLPFSVFRGSERPHTFHVYQTRAETGPGHVPIGFRQQRPYQLLLKLVQLEAATADVRTA